MMCTTPLQAYPWVDDKPAPCDACLLAQARGDLLEGGGVMWGCLTRQGEGVKQRIQKVVGCSALALLALDAAGEAVQHPTRGMALVGCCQVN